MCSSDLTGSGGGIRDVDLVLVEQEGRTFVDEEVDAFPVIFRLGEHDRLGDSQRPTECGIQSRLGQPVLR